MVHRPDAAFIANNHYFLFVVRDFFTKIMISRICFFSIEYVEYFRYCGINKKIHYSEFTEPNKTINKI